MKLLTFSVGGKARPGVLKGDKVIDLAAGLPAGIGFRRTPPVFLKDGDECVCEVEA